MSIYTSKNLYANSQRAPLIPTRIHRLVTVVLLIALVISQAPADVRGEFDPSTHAQQSAPFVGGEMINSTQGAPCTAVIGSLFPLFLPLVANQSSQASNPARQATAASVAPRPKARSLSQIVSANFAASTAFLYTGNNPVQKGIEPLAIDSQRAAVLRGQVCDKSGALSNVQITILNHPEYGSTLTNADGIFDMAVNGGGLLIVVYTKAGYLPAQRQVQVPWQDYAWLPEMILSSPDAQVTTIILNASTMQVARGSISSDVDGARRATLLIPPGTQAELVLPNGVTQTVTTLSVRATEYTVGQNGPKAMPAELPPNTGYTYALEYSTDEGQAAGATDVQFNQPLIHYVENFLNFPVGMAVPTGYYDRQNAVWVPSTNGRVVKILSITSGLADLDTDGDGTLDNGVALGVTTDERQRLATLYAAGQSLWRVPISHFTPWDCNWPYGPPTGATAPQQAPPKNNPPPDQLSCQGGSVIECQSQILGEQVDISGTPFTLNYRSDRVPGRKVAYSIDIPLSGATVPSSLARIELEVEVAGQRITQQFSAAPNQHTIFTWDGMDAYGRTVPGKQDVTTRIGYVYGAVYQEPAQFDQAFGALSGIPLTGNRARQEVTLGQEWQGTLGSFDESYIGLGGWSLNVHHVYDPKGKTLYLGDGTRRSTESLGSVIGTVAGTGTGGYNGDGIPATQAQLVSPFGVTVGPDGSLYIADGFSGRIRRVGPDGIITTVAGGTGTMGESGDGGPATLAWLNLPYDVTVGPDGSLYIADAQDLRIRRVGPDGIITTVAGTGTYGESGDGGPATQARLSEPYGVTVGPDGSLYIADSIGQYGESSRIRRVGPDGIITTVAGGGVHGLGDGGPATLAQLNGLYDVTVGPDGSLYIAEAYRIRRVGADGIITTVAGGGQDIYGNGIPATQAQLNVAIGVTVGPDGSLYIADYYTHRIRRVGSDGIITTVAGNGTPGYNGDGIPATQAQLEYPQGVAVGPDGSLYIADYWNYRIRRVNPPLPGFSLGEVSIAAEDGSEVYHFDSSGRHLRTLDALTGAVRYQFGYDSALRLTSVTDKSGNVTTITRDASGNPTAIVGPYGQQTNLAVNANGYLSSITAPGNRITQLATTSDGLLTSMTDPRGNVYQFTYDSLGRLIRDDDPAGGFKTLARTAAGQSYTVSLSTALNRTTAYQVTNPAAGGDSRADTLPSGLQNLSTRNADGTSTARTPDGTTTSEILGPDPRWGMLASIPTTTVITTPLGLQASLATTRTATLTDPDNPFSLNTLVETNSINGNSYTSTYDGASRTFTGTTPAGRVTNATIDAQGRLVQEQVSGLNSTSYTYDSRGRLSTVTPGTGSNSRIATFAYNSNGYLATITDPLGQLTSFAYDAAGRLTAQTLPDAQVIGYAYDANSNLTALTPPGQTAHNFAFTSVDLTSAYTPPSLGGGTTSTTYTYNLDRQMTSATRPDGQAVTIGYDSAGRQNALTTPRGTTSYAYSASTGNLATVNAPGGIGLSFSYDGVLRTGQTWTGPVAGSMSRVFDNNFRVTSTSVNGAQPIVFQYDQDSLLTQAGDMTLSRNAQNGLLVGSTLGSVADTIGYNGFAESLTYDAAYNGTSLYNVQRTRDKLGRITVITETIGGVTDTYGYSYDLAGRLTQVTKNSTTIASYTYDSNSNRLSVTNSGGIINGSYDSQDRLTQYGSATYAYTANGELLSKTAGGQTTTYQYDALGNLMAVTLPDGTPIDYLVDGNNRRIGKQVNGALVQGFLYEDGLRPIAELNASNNVVSRFVYATHANVPDYMIKGSVTYRIITDHLGSPRLVIDVATGAVVQRMDYDEFGRVLNDTSPGFQPFGFAGGLYDRDTKLVRFGARDYDVETGRWTAKDPIGFAGGDTNLYGYVRNSPASSIDPEGKWVVVVLAIAAVGYLGYQAYDAISEFQRDVESAREANRIAQRGFGKPECDQNVIFENRNQAIVKAAVSGFKVVQNVPEPPTSAADAIFSALSDLIIKPFTDSVPVVLESQNKP